MARRMKKPQEKEAIPQKSLLRRSFVIPGLAVLLAGIGLVAYFLLRPVSVAHGGFRDFNVLLVTLDTTRADHLPFYGYTGLRVPNMERLAGESHVFEDAIAQAPLTLPSHTCMMTGLLPPGHGIRDNAGYVLPERTTTLAEILKAAGYETGAFVSAAVLESRWGLNQGFDEYNDRFSSGNNRNVDPGDLQRIASQTEVAAEQWIENHRTGKFFAWVHFYDPHDPYDPPEPFRSQYADRLYDGEIAFVDESVGRLLSKLESLNLRKRTIIVLTADHGEGLGEHDEQTHGMFIYSSTTHVPLLVYLPGGGKSRVPGVVTHIDLAPTVLDLLGLEQPPEMQGASLVGKINNKDRKERLAYSESLYSEIHYGWSPLQSIVTDQYRYIRAPRPELFDRGTDPADTANLFPQKPAIAKVLEDKLTEMERKYTIATPLVPQQMDAETEEKLRALGYIAGRARATEESRKIDPKDKTEVARRVQEASGLIQRQYFQQAIEMIQPVLQSDPEIADAHYVAGVGYFRTGRMSEAVEQLQKAVELRPEDARALYNLGYAYDELGRLADAEFWYLKALERNPHNLSAILKLAHLYRKTGYQQKARPYFLAAAAQYEEMLTREKDDVSRFSVYVLLGEVYWGAGDAAHAENSLSAAVELASRIPTLNADCFVRLGVLYHDTGRRDMEIETFRKLVGARPMDPRGYFYLGKAIQDRRGDPREVILLASQGLALNPTPDMQVFGHYLLGNAYEAIGRKEEAKREFALAEKLEKAL